MQTSSSVLYVDRSLWLAQVGSILVSNWFGAPTLEATRGQVTALVAAIRRNAEPSRILTIIDEGTPPADDANRSTISQSMAAVNDRVGRQALAIEGRGFAASALRAMIAGMQLVSRPTHPVKVFSQVGPAVAWCAADEREGMEIEARIAELRRQHGKR